MVISKADDHFYQRSPSDVCVCFITALLWYVRSSYLRAELISNIRTFSITLTVKQWRVEKTLNKDSSVPLQSFPLRLIAN